MTHKLPPQIQQWAENEAEVFGSSMHFVAGVTALYAKLMQDAPEFDHDAPVAWFNKQYPGLAAGSYYRKYVREGAAFQHSQTSAQVAALRAEVERLREALKSIARWESMVNAPEHELRHAIGVDIPYEANSALGVKQEGGEL